MKRSRTQCQSESWQTDMTTSTSSPSALRVDAQGRLTISKQADVDEFLSGSGQDASDARQHVRALVIDNVDCPLENWPTLPSLQDLTIHFNQELSDKYPRVLCASALPALQRLTIRDENTERKSRAACPVLQGRFEQLMDIRIEGFVMPRDAFEAVLVHHAKLTHLELHRNKMGIQGCVHLARALEKNPCPNLTHLELRWNNIRANGCVRLAQTLRGHACPNLTYLGLGHNAIGCGGCKALAQALKHRDCPDIACSHFSVRRLRAENSAGVSRALQEGPCPRLTHLMLDGNGIGGTGCEHLAWTLEQGACPNFAYLSFGGNFIGERGLGRLALALQRDACLNLSHLDLRKSMISVEGLGHLMKAMQHYRRCPDVSRIRLGLKYLDARECAGVSRTLWKRPCHSLTHLDLQENNLRARGYRQLVEGLQQHACVNLTHLQLGYTKAGIRGCELLAQALEQHACPRLTHLFLRFNAIGNEGCVHLIKGLKGCPYLKCLDLSMNDIGAVPDDLGQLRSLTTLIISSNHIRRIQPALYGLILHLKTFETEGTYLEDPPMLARTRKLDALQRYIRDKRSRDVEEQSTARIMAPGNTTHNKTSSAGRPRLIPMCIKKKSSS